MKNKDEKNTMTESPDVIIGEVLPDEKADGKKKQLVSRKSDNVAFGSFITKSWTAVMQIICAKPLKTWKTGCSGFPLGMISTKRCRG